MIDIITLKDLGVKEKLDEQEQEDNEGD